MLLSLELLLTVIDICIYQAAPSRPTIRQQCRVSFLCGPFFLHSPIHEMQQNPAGAAPDGTDGFVSLGIVKHVYKNEGILGFWAGVRPNVTRTFLVNAAGDEPVMNQQPNTPPSPKPVPVQKSARMTQPKPISERRGCCPMACRLISQRVASRGFVRRWWQPQ